MENFQELDKANLQTIAPGIRRFIFTLNQVMSIYFEIDPGVVIGQHSHPNEQMGMLLKGKMCWRIRGQQKILQAPALYRIPSQEPHEVEILGEEPALVLDIFSPIREDFLKAEPPSYMTHDSRKE
jgi:quercetin dioxygenase-like cupin family protein